VVAPVTASPAAEGLDPELKRDLLLRAAEEHTSVSEIIRTAVRHYLNVSESAPQAESQVRRG